MDGNVLAKRIVMFFNFKIKFKIDLKLNLKQFNRKGLYIK